MVVEHNIVSDITASRIHGPWYTDSTDIYFRFLQSLLFSVLLLLLLSFMFRCPCDFLIRKINPPDKPSRIRSQPFANNLGHVSYVANVACDCIRCLTPNLPILCIWVYIYTYNKSTNSYIPSINIRLIAQRFDILFTSFLRSVLVWQRMWPIYCYRSGKLTHGGGSKPKILKLKSRDVITAVLSLRMLSFQFV